MKFIYFLVIFLMLKYLSVVKVANIEYVVHKVGPILYKMYL